MNEPGGCFEITFKCYLDTVVSPTLPPPPPPPNKTTTCYEDLRLVTS